MSVGRIIRLATLACVILSAISAAWVRPSVAETAAAQNPAPAESRAEPRPTSALWLFAAVEEAWVASDAERLAALVDTSSVRIAVKPGTPPAAALTRGAAAFLFQDQLRLVKTREFRIRRLERPKKGPTRATAVWTGDWGGRLGVRDVRISLTAAPVAGRWVLTEVRASD
jgi:hypothetical protein